MALTRQFQTAKALAAAEKATAAVEAERSCLLRIDASATTLRRAASKASNAEKAAAEACIPLRKLLENLARDPSEQKFRRLRTGNATVKAKLLPVDAAKELLFAVGFVPSKNFEHLTIPAELEARIIAARAARALVGLGATTVSQGRGYNAR